MTHEELIQSYKQGNENFIEVLDSITTGNFNKVPPHGGWTAGQVAEHILKSQAGLDHAFDSNTHLEDRAPDEKEPMIRAVFLDYERKMKSPDFIEPTDRDKVKDSIVDALKDITASNVSAAENFDLNQTCRNMELPVMGYLTGVELLYFMKYHTQRHTEQLKKIRSAL